MWTEGKPLPYDGWYGGRVDMMIANGTYVDYRGKILRRVERGFYSSSGTIEERIEAGKKKLAEWDKIWGAIPEEELLKRRNRVADDLELKEVIVYTAKGPMRTFKAKPSANNNLDKRDRNAVLKKKNAARAGSIEKSDNPSVVRIVQEAAPVVH